ncbi:uncharacterized protein LOC118189652 isoform X2 [Stegodyphus dumicola]|uniref:uncharacterized protein LOC118189652 isoform X2 n=1 Tax=Stegodyphus dumicola TaxID=202533 RepID=UPI0015ADDC14|nr:uncharacterized protein LOC118189652 isoform X2 [Stegodyphus dumicola]XP_035216206.1 uncharacterized protein LOC118189652 isoform X2 [Stegodyphus dumicola]
MRLLCVLPIIAAVLVSGECRVFSSLFNDSDDKEIDTNCLDKDVDAYLDKVLERARKELPDPMRLPPRSTIVELHEGVLWGMSTLERSGPSKVTCENSTVTISGKLTVEELKGRYTWKKERKNNDAKEGYIVFISDDFEADVEIVIERQEGEETHPRLTRFEIKKFKKARIEMTGGFLPWLLGEMGTLISGIFQRAIGWAVQDPLKEALERQMRDISLD